MIFRKTFKRGGCFKQATSADANVCRPSKAWIFDGDSDLNDINVMVKVNHSQTHIHAKRLPSGQLPAKRGFRYIAGPPSEPL